MHDIARSPNQYFLCNSHAGCPWERRTDYSARIENVIGWDGELRSAVSCCAASSVRCVRVVRGAAAAAPPRRWQRSSVPGARLGSAPVLRLVGKV